MGKQGPGVGGSGLIRFGFSDDSPGLKVYVLPYSHVICRNRLVTNVDVDSIFG
jgi:hypothetical protein